MKNVSNAATFQLNVGFVIIRIFSRDFYTGIFSDIYNIESKVVEREHVESIQVLLLSGLI